MPPRRRPGSKGFSWTDWVSDQWQTMADSAAAMVPGAPGNPLTSMAGALAGSLDAMPVGTPMAPQLLAEQLLDLAQSRLRGRELTIATGSPSGDARLRLRDVRFELSPLPLAVGQLGMVEVDADSLAWGAVRLRNVSASFANVHVRPGLTPTLVCAPVRLHAVIGQAELDEMIAGTSMGVHVELTDDGPALLTGPSWQRLGRAQVEPWLDDDRIRFRTGGVVVRGRRLALPRTQLPGVSLALPPLPVGLRLTRIELRAGQVHVDGLVEELRAPLATDQLQRLAKAMRAGAAQLDLRRPG